MSIRVMTSVWEKSRATGDGLLLLLAIADYANEDGEAWPAVESLASKARCTRRHAQRLVRSLVKLKELEVELAVGRRNCNRYTVTLGKATFEAGKGDKLSPGHSEPQKATFDARKGDLDVARSVSTRHDPSSVQQGELPASNSNGGNPAAAPPPARTRRDAIQASKIQYAALKSRIEELELAKKNGEFTAEDRAELRQVRKDLEILQKKQRRGQF